MTGHPTVQHSTVTEPARYAGRRRTRASSSIRAFVAAIVAGVVVRRAGLRIVAGMVVSVGGPARAGAAFSLDSPWGGRATVDGMEKPEDAVAQEHEGGTRGDPERVFEDYRRAFRREGQRLVMYVGVYRYLHERRHDRLTELNLAPSFFITITDALFRAIVVLAHSLLVGGVGNAVSLRNYLNFLSRNIALFTPEAWARRRGVAPTHECLQGRVFPTHATIRADQKRLHNLPALANLEMLRNKGLAHFEMAYFLNPHKLHDEAPLRWSDLIEI